MITTFHTHDMLVGIDTINGGITTAPGPNFMERFVIQGDMIEDEEVFGIGGYHAVATIDRAKLR